MNSPLMALLTTGLLHISSSGCQAGTGDETLSLMLEVPYGTFTVLAPGLPPALLSLVLAPKNLSKEVRLGNKKQNMEKH